MAKSRFSFEKRRKEKENKAKKEAKRESRAERKAEATGDAVPILELDEWGNPVLPEDETEETEETDEEDGARQDADG